MSYELELAASVTSATKMFTKPLERLIKLGERVAAALERAYPDPKTVATKAQDKLDVLEGRMVLATFILLLDPVLSGQHPDIGHHPQQQLRRVGAYYKLYRAYIEQSVTIDTISENPNGYAQEFVETFEHLRSTT